MVKQDDNCTVKVQKVIDVENDEVLLYCHSTKREKKNRLLMIVLLYALKRLSASLSQICIEKDEKSDNAVKILWTCQPIADTKDSLPRVYCLRTISMELDEAALWRTYTMLTDLETVFRSRS